METGNEKQNVNIAEILRYAPKMLELFSPIYGEVYFDYVNEEGTDIHVKTKLCGGSVATFNANGTFYDLPNSERLLFPSINHRCWNHWQNTLFLESIGSVCIDTITGYKYILENNGTFFSDGTGSGYSVIIENDESNYFLNSRYATPEETKEFFEELEKNGYKWDGKTVVKKEDKQKFYVGDNIYTWEDGKGLKKEQNKPKFKVDDWIVNNENGKVSQIKKIVYDESGYGYDHTNGWFHSVFEKDYHLWTIQDAKDGDVLSNGKMIVIFKHFEDPSYRQHIVAHIGLDAIGDIQITDDTWELGIDKAKPATKEQRDILFTKMKEEGFKWNADTKKLIKTTIPIPKFKEGDVIKHTPTGEFAIIKHICSDYYVLDKGTSLYFESQDMWELIASKVNPTIEEKVNILADEILALKEKLLALEKLAKDSEIKIDALECGGKPFQCSDKAGDSVTLKDMGTV